MTGFAYAMREDYGPNSSYEGTSSQSQSIFNKVGKVSQMTKSSIDTFDPEGMLRREEASTSLIDEEARPKNFSYERDERSNESQARRTLVGHKDSNLYRSATQITSSIPVQKGYLRMMIMMDQALTGSQTLFDKTRQSHQNL